MASAQQNANATQYNPSANVATLSLNDITIAPPKLNKVGGKSSNVVFKHNNKSLMLAVDDYLLTWGANVFEDKVDARKKSYDMAFQFPRSEYSTPKTDLLLQKFQELENYFKEEAMRNSMVMFNKKTMTKEVIEALWTPMLKHPKDKETGEPDTTKPPTLKIKLPYYNDKFGCEIYNDNGVLLYGAKHETENTPLDLITKGINVRVVIQCGGLWFANGKFGCTWRLYQAIVQPKQSLSGKCLLSFSPAENSESVSAQSSVQPTQTVQEIPVTVQSDSTNDEVVAAVQVKDIDTIQTTTTTPVETEPSGSSVGTKKAVKIRKA